MRTPIKAAAILAALLAAACSPRETISPTLGDAVTYNKQIQMVHPERAAQTAETATESGRDGHAAASAYDRYRDGKVVRPKAPASSSIGGVR